MKHYTLDGKTPLLATDFGEWALWFETANRRVAFTQLKNVSVSTVFLGTDQALLPGDPPLLFETKVFGGPADAELRRYATWDDAEQGHGAVVSRIEALLGSMGPRAKMDSMPEGA
jgi:hypothetical protein